MKHFTTTVTLQRRVKGPGSEVGVAWKYEPIECRVDLAIDEERLFTLLGERALRNKSKRTVEIGGLVTAEVRVK